MLVIVTKKHIDSGVPGSSRSCPIALALKEKFPYSIVDVCGTVVDIRWSNQCTCTTLLRYKTSRRMNRFVHQFDRHNQVEPTTFRLTDPEVRTI